MELNLQTREGTTDSMTVGSLGQYSKLPIPQGCVVLDIGGHIGSFTRYALHRGAGRVVAYEPEPDNFRMLRINTEGYPVTIHNKAVTGDGRNVTLNVKVNGHTGGHSIITQSKNRTPITVPSESFKEIMNQVNPEVVKIDCEGAEYEFGIPENLSPSVKYITLEIHLGRKELRNNKAPKLINDLNQWGHAIKPANPTPKAWTVVGVWERK